MVPVTGAAMLESELRHLRASHRSVTLQAYAPGVGVAAFALLDKGELRASFMHRRLHEVPHTGGVSAYRCSWTHPAIHADALRRLRHLEHQGAAMVEYRECLDAARGVTVLTEGNEIALNQAHNYSVEMEERIAEQFNVAVRAYKARQAGDG